MASWLSQWVAQGVRAWMAEQGIETVRAHATAGHDVVRLIVDAYAERLGQIPLPIATALRLYLRDRRQELVWETWSLLAQGEDEVAQLARTHSAWFMDHLTRLGNLLLVRLEADSHGRAVAKH